KSYGKAWKDVGKGLGKGLKDVGKMVGQVAEGGMGLLQSMGQGQGQEAEEEPQEEQFEEGSQETSEEFEQTSEEQTSEESSYEEPIDESENLEELNGELGFLPQAMMAAGTAGQIFSSFNNMQQQNAQAKHARSMDKINAFSSLLKRPAPAKKKAVSKPNSTFSNPKLSQSPEGAFKLSYAASRDASGSDNSTDPKSDKNNMIYIGGAIAVVLVLVMMMNKKGR
ncbi:hypothetical protein QMM60_17645, partial [Leptospira santarosai]|nr:hypothetical protein [Leptospira santarosai]